MSGSQLDFSDAETDYALSFRLVREACARDSATDPYQRWVYVWRDTEASDIAVEIITEDDDYFGQMTTPRVNLAILTLLDVLDDFSTRSREWQAYDHRAEAARLTELIKRLGDENNNRCWDKITSEFKSRIIITAATS